MQNSELLQLTQMVEKSREFKYRVFNPYNEPLVLMRVIEKKFYRTARRMVGAEIKNEDLSRDYGYEVFEQAPAIDRKRNRTESDDMASGKLTSFHYYDPDMLDEREGLPMLRKFVKDEIFLATAKSAIWMEYQGYATIAPRYKNSVDETSGVPRFNWAEKDEMITDDNGILIKKYQGRYMEKPDSSLDLAKKIIELTDKLERLESQRGNK